MQALIQIDFIKFLAIRNSVFFELNIITIQSRSASSPKANILTPKLGHCVAHYLHIWIYFDVLRLINDHLAQ